MSQALVRSLASELSRAFSTAVVLWSAGTRCPDCNVHCQESAPCPDCICSAGSRQKPIHCEVVSCFNLVVISPVFGVILGALVHRKWVLYCTVVGVAQSSAVLNQPETAAVAKSDSDSSDTDLRAIAQAQISAVRRRNGASW